MTAAPTPHPDDRVNFTINRGVVASIVVGALGLTGLAAGIIASGEVSPGSISCLLFGLSIAALAAPKLRPGPILVCDRTGLEAVRLSLRLRWEEIERMKLTKQRTSRGQSVTYLDIWPTDLEAAIAQIRRRLGPFAGIFTYGGAGAIRITIFLWSAPPSTVADQIERISGRSIER